MMGSVATMSAALTQGGIRRIYFASARGGAVAAVVGFAAGTFLGHPLWGAAFVLGLAMGLVNALGVRAMAARAAARGGGKAPAVTSSIRRLGLVTLVVFAVFMLDRYAGLAVLGGLAVFQMLLMVSSSLVLLRQLREQHPA